MGMDESTGNITIQTAGCKPFRMKKCGRVPTTKKGKRKEDWWTQSLRSHHGIRKGIDVFNKEDEKKMLKEIQANYKFEPKNGV